MFQDCGKSDNLNLWLFLNQSREHVHAFLRSYGERRTSTFAIDIVCQILLSPLVANYECQIMKISDEKLRFDNMQDDNLFTMIMRAENWKENVVRKR